MGEKKKVYFDYPEYVEFPKELRDLGFIDDSFRNDAACCCTLPLPNSEFVSVWVQPSEECDEMIMEGKRYSVETGGEGKITETLTCTDDFDDVMDVVLICINAYEDYEPVSNRCDCGAKHTCNPNLHADWCSTS